MAEFYRSLDHLTPDILSEEYPRLVRLCLRLTSDAAVAEEIAQETLIVAWQRAGQLRNPQAQKAWLNGIARNLCARWWREQGRRGLPSVTLDDAPDAIMADEPDFTLDLEREELATLLDQALALLPAETRTILIQSTLENTPHAKIAAQLGLSENLVAVRLHRGKVALRRLLADELREDVIALGLIMDQNEWQETRLWCTGCGQRRLMGWRDERQFTLRCPGCSVEPDAVHSQSTLRPEWAALKTFAPLYKHFAVWINNFFQQAIAAGEATCQRCGRITPLRYGLPLHVPPSVRRKRGVHTFCNACGSSSYSALEGLSLNTPEGRQFRQAHPRLRTLPDQEIEAEGLPAIVSRFESIDASATFDVVVARDTYRVLRVEGGQHG